MKFLKTIFLKVIFLALVCSAMAESGIKEDEKRVLDHAFTLMLNISETPKFHDQENYKSDYKEFVKRFKAKKEKWNNEGRLLKDLFYKVHRKYLKEYAPYQSFQKVFAKGTYGCLTGTALYAFMLEELGYEFKIIETNYHMFLLVNTQEHQYLLESTDPLYGFVSDAREIEVRIKEAQDKNKYGGGKNAFSYHIYKSISYIELIGLQYYNLAVDAYNRKEIGKALYCLNEASRINKSERVEEFLKVLLNSVENRRFIENAILSLDELSGLLATN